MTIMRQEIKIEITGAAQAERELKGVVGAEKGVEAAAGTAAAKLNILGREITGTATASDKAAKALKGAGAGIEKSAQSTSVLSSALGALRKAAEIIPGMELGTMFAAVAAGAVLLASKLFGASDAAVAMAKSGAVLNESMVAEALNVKDLSDGMDRYAKSVGLADVKAMTFLDHQRALRSIAMGETKDVGVELKRTEELSKKLADLDYKLRTARAVGMSEDDDRMQALVREVATAKDILIAQDMDVRILSTRKDGILSTPQTPGMTGDWFARMQGGKKAAEAEARKSGGSRAAPRAVAAAGSSVIPGFGGMQADAAFARSRYLEGAERRNRDAAELPPDYMTQFGPDREAAVPSFMSMLTADADEKAKFHADLAEASESTKAVFGEMGAAISDAGGMLTGFGKGMAQAAAATLLTGAGFKKFANQMLQGLAIQALGQALFEAAMGTAALGMAFLGYPGAGPAAAAHFQAAGMFGAIAAGAALGVGATGGFSKGGAGGSGSSSAAAGTNPYQGTGGGNTQVVVMIGGEVVTRGVQVETRKQAQRGGISEPRMAMAS